MTFTEFLLIDNQFRKEKPSLFRLSISAPPAAKDEIELLESNLKLRLPTEYKEFLEHFGGGEFGLINLFCADPDSEWYLLKRVKEAGRFIPDNFIPVSDDYAGGYYGFGVENLELRPSLLYWNQDGGTIETQYSNLFEFVVQNAYGE